MSNHHRSEVDTEPKSENEKARLRRLRNWALGFAIPVAITVLFSLLLFVNQHTVTRMDGAPPPPARRDELAAVVADLQRQLGDAKQRVADVASSLTGEQADARARQRATNQRREHLVTDREEKDASGVKVFNELPPRMRKKYGTAGGAD